MAAAGGVHLASPRQRLLGLCVLAWAARLGCFLFARIRRHGGVDNRFAAVKPDVLRFARFWGIQVREEGIERDGERVAVCRRL